MLRRLAVFAGRPDVRHGGHGGAAGLRAEASELPELADHVCLIGIAAVEGEAAPVRCQGRECRGMGALEAHQPGCRLRRPADLDAEAFRQAAPAPAEVAGQGADAHLAVARPQPPPGPGDLA